MSASYWPGWLSGIALSALILSYFWVTGRLLSGSGRVTAVVDRLRYGPQPEYDATPEELAEALRQASIEAFGESAVREALEKAGAEPEPEPPAAGAVCVRPRIGLTWVGHLAFLIGLVLGGRAAQPWAPVEWSLGTGVWAGRVPESALPYLLLGAGLLVGFGTRMAGGCTLGHGLCGMPRGYAGSWAAALAFFAGAVALSLGLVAL